jgi:uncharacterized membrane protein
VARLEDNGSGRMWENLEHVKWVKVLAQTGWLYVLVSVIHYFTLLFFIGTIVLVDLRILGVADRNQTVSQLAEQLVPWTWVGFALAMISGFLLFTTDAGDYAFDTPFRVKMLTILLAFIFAMIVQWNVPAWNRLPAMPAAAKVVAFLSLVLWLGTILAGVEIAALSGLG